MPSSSAELASPLAEKVGNANQQHAHYVPSSNGHREGSGIRCWNFSLRYAMLAVQGVRRRKNPRRARAALARACACEPTAAINNNHAAEYSLSKARARCCSLVESSHDAGSVVQRGSKEVGNAQTFYTPAGVEAMTGRCCLYIYTCPRCLPLQALCLGSTVLYQEEVSAPRARGRRRQRGNNMI